MKPIRMCVACRSHLPKEELLRVVKKDGIPKIDLSGKEQCRGAYLCKSKECLNRVVKTRAFNRAFKSEIPDEFLEQLRRIIDEQT